MTNKEKEQIKKALIEKIKRDGEKIKSEYTDKAAILRELGANKKR